MSTPATAQPSMINRLTANAWALTIVVAAGATLFIALIMEHAFGMDPCPLCLMQRVWIFFAALMAYASLLHNPRLGIYPLLTIVCAAVGAYFAAKQLHLQGLPADQVPSCGPDLQYMFDEFPLLEVLTAMTQGTGDCAKVSFRFLGLTLPGWALLACLGIAGLAVAQWRAALRGVARSR